MLTVLWSTPEQDWRWTPRWRVSNTEEMMRPQSGNQSTNQSWELNVLVSVWWHFLMVCQRLGWLIFQSGWWWWASWQVFLSSSSSPSSSGSLVSSRGRESLTSLTVSRSADNILRSWMEMNTSHESEPEEIKSENFWFQQQLWKLFHKRRTNHSINIQERNTKRSVTVNLCAIILFSTCHSMTNYWIFSTN